MMRTLKTVLIFSICILIFSENANAQKKKKKEWTPHYQQPGKFSLGTEKYILTDLDHLIPPLSIVPEIAVLKNLSLGIFLNWYYFRSRIDHEYYSQWMDEIFIHSFSTGLRATYHLASVANDVGIKVKANRFNPFISGYGGYRFATSHDDVSTSVDGNYVVGAMFGLRYFYSKKLAFHFQGGYSDLGYANVGITWVLSEVR